MATEIITQEARELYEPPLLVDVEEAAAGCGLCTTGGSAAVEAT